MQLLRADFKGISTLDAESLAMCAELNVKAAALQEDHPGEKIFFKA